MSVIIEGKGARCRRFDGHHLFPEVVSAWSVEPADGSGFTNELTVVGSDGPEPGLHLVALAAIDQELLELLANAGLPVWRGIWIQAAVLVDLGEGNPKVLGRALARLTASGHLPADLQRGQRAAWIEHVELVAELVRNRSMADEPVVQPGDRLAAVETAARGDAGWPRIDQLRAEREEPFDDPLHLHTPDRACCLWCHEALVRVTVGMAGRPARSVTFTHLDMTLSCANGVTVATPCGWKDKVHELGRPLPAELADGERQGEPDTVF